MHSITTAFTAAILVSSAAMQAALAAEPGRFGPAPRGPAPPGTVRLASASWQYDPRPTLEGYLNSTAGMAKLVAQAAQDGAELILFPETGVNTPWSATPSCPWESALQNHAEVLPLISNRTDAPRQTPCIDAAWQDRPISQSLSCMARENGIYVAASMFTSVLCDSKWLGNLCPPGGVIVFNTMVVYDRHGALVAKFYKRNLAEEAPAVTQPTPRLLQEYPDNPVLHTDFGVDFGLVICNDLFNAQPVDADLDAGVTSFLYSNEAVTTPITGTQLNYAQSTAQSLHVNLVTSGAATGANGVGIFSAGEPIAMFSSPAICTGEDLATIDPVCLGYVVGDMPINPRVTPPASFEHRTPSAGAPAIISEAYDCAGLDQAHMSAKVPVLANLTATEYDAFVSRAGMTGRCVRIVLEPGSSVQVSVEEPNGASCQVTVALSEDESPREFVLRAGSLPYIFNTPCRGEVPVCAFLPAEEFKSGTLVGNASNFSALRLEFNSLKPVTDRRPRSVGGVLGDAGVTKPLNRNGVELRFNSARSATAVSAQGEILAVHAGVVMRADESWPACRECFDTLLGSPIGASQAVFPAAKPGSSVFTRVTRAAMCSTCADPLGFERQAVWPPQWTRQ